MNAADTLLAARELLKDLTPLKTDCGKLCGAACCQGDEQTGMLLFPGEEKLLDGCAFGSIIPAAFELGSQTAKLFVCSGRCERENRPLACRLFPLFLAFKDDGVTKLRIDQRAKAVCPLTDYGIKALDPEFKQAARKAYDLMLEDEACAAFLRDLYQAFTL
ncbi:MAG: hypothetical protein IJ381_01090 [Clostridia bacterium]|nr:hypothetical protein [Clostridia bacterium]